ncbi:MBL fold metallo-hydrolase [Phragmitibacter flavus]|uniref:MBL fold metallo-hydrolase n=1 Tax=Phragmitibacter flavus TaxID=2576071 RepID=A0A5R8KFU0_9BACT|nr:MBL fold metallo-hydrolase [Phragmitibacter flavus]TLD71194.1 MBL fold metallo-hydrolase [Phragmitibacter flavus]
MSKVHTLDLKFRGMAGTIAAFLVECGAGELALVETGPGSTLENLLVGIREAGFDPGDVKHVLVTHVHLDHAGAAGWWAQKQGAKVYAHPRAVGHLMDPTKLLGSAKMVYGERMEELWGEMLPVPEEQMVTVEDGGRIEIGETVFVAHDTPGHARHHHVFEIEGEGVCFTGDVAGVRLQGQNYISVAAAPPQFDPVAYEASILKLQAMKFKRLYLTHFGALDDVAAHMEMERLRVAQVHQTVGSFLRAGYDAEKVRRSYEQSERMFAGLQGVVRDADWDLYQCANHTDMGADGIALYCEKRAAG